MEEIGRRYEFIMHSANATNNDTLEESTAGVSYDLIEFRILEVMRRKVRLKKQRLY